MLCGVVPPICYVKLCYAILWLSFATLVYVVFCYDLWLSFATLVYVVSCYDMLCLLCRVMWSRHVTSGVMVRCYVSCYVLPCHEFCAMLCMYASLCACIYIMKVS